MPAIPVVSTHSTDEVHGPRRLDVRAESAETSPDEAPAARVIDARKVYGKGSWSVSALDGVSVDIPARRFTAVMGPSGSGKSTLLHCLAGLDTLTSGRVVLGDTDLATLRDKDLTVLRRTRVGFVFQAYNLVPTLSAAENITLPADLAGARIDPAWLAVVLHTVDLGDRLRHRPAQLSGGQQQRVAVARALVTRPDLIVADEPTGNLDSHTSGELLAFLRHAVDELDMTVVMVTHDATAAAYADQVVFLADGQVSGIMPEPTAERVLDRIKELSS
jgi:putative ABC transport system ATP-binding protein